MCVYIYIYYIYYTYVPIFTVCVAASSHGCPNIYCMCRSEQSWLKVAIDFGRSSAVLIILATTLP